MGTKMGDGGGFLTPCTDFSRPVEQLEYSCLLKITFTQDSHDRGLGRWSRWWVRGGTRSLSVHYFSSYLLCLLKVETHTWSQRTNFHKTLFFSDAYHLTWLNWIKHKTTQMVCTNREKETDWDTFFFEKNPKKIITRHFFKKKSEKIPLYQGTGMGCPVALLGGFPSKSGIH